MKTQILLTISLITLPSIVIPVLLCVYVAHKTSIHFIETLAYEFRKEVNMALNLEI